MFTFFFPGLTYAQSAYTVPAGGATSLTTAGSGSSISVGYGRLQVSSGAAPGGFAVFGFRLGGILVNESAVPASGRLSAGRIYAELSESVNTGLAIANPSPQTATITFYFTDSSGNSTTSRTMTLGPNGQTAKFLSQDPFNGTSPFRGSFTFSSSVPVSVIALRGLSNQRGDFLITALPVADLNTSITDSLIFPHYADGGGWTTQIVLVNPSNQSIAGTIRFSNPVGVVSSPDTISIQRQFGVFEYSIPPRSARRLITGGGPATAQAGWLRVTPTGGTPAPSGTAIFSYQRGGITVTEGGVPNVRESTAFRVYAEAAGDFNGSISGSVQTGVAVANLSSSAATVNFELLTMSGTASGLTGTIDLAQNGQRAAFLNQIPGFEQMPSTFQGILRITTSSPATISVTGLRARFNERRDLLIATTPPVSETAGSSGSELIFPHLADAGGYTTQFVLLAPSPSQSSAGTLQFVTQSGASWNLGTAAAVVSRELTAASATNDRGEAALRLSSGTVTFRFVDEATGLPIPDLSVGMAVNADKGRGVLLVIDPSERYPLRFVRLQARAQSSALTEDRKETANSVEDLLVVLNKLESTPIVNKVVEIPGVSAASGAFDDFAGVASLIARTMDQFGVPVGKYAQKLSRAETEEMTTDQAMAKVREDLANGIKDKLYMFITEGDVPDVPGLMLDAFSLGVDANAVWNCSIGNRNVIATTIRVGEKEVLKMYNCKERGIVLSEAIPFTFGLSDPYGLPLCSGSLELISKTNIGAAYVRPLNQGTGSATAPPGNYRANVRCPNTVPRTSDPELPRGGGPVTLRLDPPAPATPPTTPPPATPAVATVELRPGQLTGFLDPGATVAFTATPRDRNGSVVNVSCTFVVYNPAGSVVATINSSTGVLTAGNAQGAARVEATCGGVTSNSVLVSGRGGTTTPPAETVTQFDGRYSGQYSGSATLDGDTYPVSGPVAFTISNGTISMTQPGSGTGSVSSSGSASFSVSGGVSVEGASCRYAAAFTVTSGVARGSGNFACTYDGGSASGTWSATRQ